MKVTEYHRIRLEDLSKFEAAGWRAVEHNGKPVVEGLTDGNLLVALVMRDVEED